MARLRIYIKPFKTDMTYGDWIEVTRDAPQGAIGKISKKLDVSEFDVGVYTNSSIGLSLRNDHGRYSDVDYVTSIFRYKRADSLVRVTWDLANWDFFAGVSEAGEIQGQEVTIYEGLLNDDATAIQLKSHQISFTALGYESVLDRTVVPDWTGSPPADNKASTLIKSMLAGVNAQLTQDILTVDNGQINPSYDAVFDDITVFANKTCKEALKTILTASNSVLYMSGTTPIVSARTASVAVAYNFYGPESALGLENIALIQDIRSGLNRTFNFVSWKDTTLVQKDVDSIEKVGIRKKELDVAGITDTTKRNAILSAIKNEFGSKKQEFKLTTNLNYDILALSLLAKISIDFPVIPVSTEDLAIYGIAEYGVAKYPVDLEAFTILPTDYYKILGIEIDTKTNTAILNLRKVT